MAAAKNQPIPGGYDTDAFLQKPDDDYICTICQSVLREPVLTKCGHRFCKACLDEWWRSQATTECPVDREKLRRDKDVFADKATERKILSLHIKCSNNHCKWTGELGYVEKHTPECVIDIPCPNKDCKVSCSRIAMKDHERLCEWRNVDCTYCSQQYPTIQNKKHQKVCLKFPLDCKLGCSKTIPRKEMAAHCKDICPLTVISCEYEDLGCTAKIQRQALNDHLNGNVKQHLDLSRLKIVNFQQQLDQNRVAPFIWKIPQFGEVMRKAEAGEEMQVYSPPIQSEPHGYRFVARLDPIGMVYDCEMSQQHHIPALKRIYMSVYIGIVKGEYDPLLEWPCCKVISALLLSKKRQGTRTPLRHKTNFMMPTSNGRCGDNSIGWCYFQSHDDLQEHVIDDTIYLKLQIEDE